MKLNAKNKVLIVGLAALLPLLNEVGSFAASTGLFTEPKTTSKVVIDPLDKYRGAKELTSQELVDLLRQVGFKGKSLRIAWAIVMRESRGNPTSHNTNASTGDNSYGLFQINMLGSLGEDRRDKFGIKNNAELLDPVTNAQAAFYMSGRGTNFGSWGLGPDAYDGSASESSITIWLDKFPG